MNWQKKGFMLLTMSYCGLLHILLSFCMVGIIEEARDKGASHQLTSTSLGLAQMKPWRAIHLLLKLVRAV